MELQVRRLGEFKAALQQRLLKVCQTVLTDGWRGQVRLETKGGQLTRRFANIPFDGMETITAVGEMCRADVFAS